MDKGRKDEETVKDYANSFRYVKARLGHFLVHRPDGLGEHLTTCWSISPTRGWAYYRHVRWWWSRGPLGAPHGDTGCVPQLEKALASATSLGKIPVNIAKLVDIPATGEAGAEEGPERGTRPTS